MNIKQAPDPVIESLCGVKKNGFLFKPQRREPLQRQELPRREPRQQP